MKWVGLCTLCDAECFEIRERYTRGVLAGKPRRVGAPLEGARRVHLVFADGTTGNVTLCSSCEATPDTMGALFHEIRETSSAEGRNDHREAAGGKPLDLRQRWITGAVQLRLTDNIPLGVLFEERWTDAYAREIHGRAAR
jgi:hypothetical protein